jgi:hypothetical protein
MASTTSHIVLLGDSIFDNGAYTSGQPDVLTHLRRLLPHTWEATLCAIDGATTSGLRPQLACVPSGASHLFVSIGGNDALQNIDLLSLPVTSTGDALQIFARRLEAFERAYRSAIEAVAALKRRTILCTIYNGALEEPRAVPARVALSLFNDAILRTALDFHLDALDLRSVCTDPADYANPIEPSGRGGLKIARAIARVAGALDQLAGPSRLWGGED